MRIIIFFLLLFTHSLVHALTPAQMMMMAASGCSSTTNAIYFCQAADDDNFVNESSYTVSTSMGIVGSSLEVYCNSEESPCTAKVTITRSSANGGTLSFSHKESAVTDGAFYKVGSGSAVGLTETTTLTSVTGVSYASGSIKFEWYYTFDPEATMTIDNVVFTDTP